MTTIATAARPALVVISTGAQDTREILSMTPEDFSYEGYRRITTDMRSGNTSRFVGVGVIDLHNPADLIGQVAYWLVSGQHHIDELAA